jgi:undecaprenyl-diphosphatase
LALHRTLRNFLDLPRRVLAAVVVALTALAASVTLLAVTTDDVTEHSGLSAADPSRLRFVIDHRGTVLVHLAKSVTELGTAPVLAAFAIVAAGLLWRRRTSLVVAVAPAIALGAAAVVAAATKAIVGRARPPVGLRLVTESEPSFPSGHATDSTAFFAALALVVAVYVLRRPIARAAVLTVGIALPALIGASRLVLGVHWPTDVLAGWALGMTSAIAVVLMAAAVDQFGPTRLAKRDAPATRDGLSGLTYG